MDKGRVIANVSKEKLNSIITDKDKYEILINDITNINEKELSEIKGVSDVEFKENKYHSSNFKY